MKTLLILGLLWGTTAIANTPLECTSDHGYDRCWEA